MEIYLVGGSVRNNVLKKEHPDIFSRQNATDSDYVIVGASEDDIKELQKSGYQMVGKDFPIWLSPNGDEYAIARSIRGSAGPDKVSLEDDLGRRDLTMNAMAQRKDGSVVDPFGGMADIRNKVLRHVGDSFSEDPLRVLRLARFSARFPEFSIAGRTKEICISLADSGALEKVSPDRVWNEMQRGLMEYDPVKFLHVLKELKVLKNLFPELDILSGVMQPLQHHPEGDVWTHTIMALRQAIQHNLSVDERVAVLFHDVGKGVTPKELLPSHVGHEDAGEELIYRISNRYPLTKNQRKLALTVCENHTRVHTCMDIKKPSSLLRLLEKTHALQKNTMFEQTLAVCQMDAQGRLGKESTPYPQADYLREARNVLSCVPETDAWREHVVDEPDNQKSAEAKVRLQINALNYWLKTQSLSVDREENDDKPILHMAPM